MSTERTLTFEEVDTHIMKHLAERVAAVGPGAAVPAAAFNLCSVYKMVRPLLLLASQTFFIPQAWRTAITMLIGVLDQECPQGQ